MSNNELEIKDRKEMEAIIQQAQVCRIGFLAEDVPYIVPMHFGYKDNCLYFHTATKGRKLDIIRRHSKVGFAIDIHSQVVKPPTAPCGWGIKYRSVIGVGQAFIIEDLPEKSAALNILTQHYGADWYNFSEKELEDVCVIKIEIISMTGRKAEYLT